jgi:hypothetical protein
MSLSPALKEFEPLKVENVSSSPTEDAFATRCSTEGATTTRVPTTRAPTVMATWRSKEDLAVIGGKHP